VLGARDYARTVRRLTPARLATAGLVLLVVVAAVLWVTPSSSYIFLPDEAHPVEPLVTVEGGEAPKDGGGIYFVDVFVRKATLLERIFPGLHDGSTIVPASAVRPPGVSDTARRKADLRAMSRSQEVAAAVALRALGYDVEARPTGALIDQVFTGAPAAGRLRPGDVVISVDGRPVRTREGLRRELTRKPARSAVRLGVRRGSELREIRLRTAAHPATGRPVIGVFVEQAADVMLPLDVKIDSGEIGGPSAGLPFALDILEELGRDVDRGHRIAATGEIELDGRVESIGGIRQKTIGVKRAGVEIFLVPAGDNAREAARYADGLRIIPVRNFQQALRALATLRRRA
jgi:PDZ domain-containing protein